MTGVPPSHFDHAYDGRPPWDIGRPQGAFVALADRIQVAGPLLDVGCGTGENTILFAARGVASVGIDFAPRAVERAQEKARARSSSATFEVADALALDKLGRTFATAIDSAVFHVWSDEDRPRYVRSLEHATRSGSRVYILVFSEREPADWGGPRRVSRSEIESAFASGWRVVSIEAAHLETTFHKPPGGLAWFATIERT